MGWWVGLVDPESNGKQSVTSTDERQRCALACENDEIEQNGEERWGGGVREREREREYLALVEGRNRDREKKRKRKREQREGSN